MPIYLGKGLVEAEAYRDRDAIKADLKTLDAATEALPSGQRKAFL